MSALDAASMERYQAHLALPSIGVQGQRRLRDRRVLVVGLGGLGCPAALYLAAAGVGSLGLVDDDSVDTTNLQRQILYTTDDIGAAKVAVAARRLARLNPEVEITEHHERVTAGRALAIVGGWDLVLDGSDNFATRYVVNDACVLASVGLVTGSLYREEGQVSVVKPGETACVRCTAPVPPAEQEPCREAGVLAPLAGIVGSIMAAEAIRWIAAGTASLAGRLLLLDVAGGRFQTLELRRDPGCPVCGERPTIDRPTATTDHVRDG